MRAMRLLLPVALVLLVAAAAQGATSRGAVLCLPVGKVAAGIKLPGANNPPGYVRLPPGIRLPGAVQCPRTAKPTKLKAKQKTSKPSASPAPVTAKPTGCPKGTIALTVLARRSCISKARAGSLPPDRFLMFGSVLTRDAIVGKESRAVDRALTREARPGKPAPVSGYGPAQSDVTAIGGTFDEFVQKAKTWPYDAGVAAREASSVRAPVGPIRVVQAAAAGPTVTWNGPTSSNTASEYAAGATATVSDGNGVTATVKLEGRIPKDQNGELVPSEARLGFDVSASKGQSKGSFGFSLSTKTMDGLKFDAPCPTAAGDVNAKEEWDVKTQNAVENQGLFTFRRENLSIRDLSSWHGSVDPDATLQKIAFSHTIALSFTRAWAIGPLPGSISASENVTASGTIDGRSGAVTLDSVNVTGDGYGTGLASGFASDFRAALPNESGWWRQMLSDLARMDWERFKSAEKEWREENRCAKLTFDPASPAQVNPGSTAGVAGTVTSKQDSKPSDSKWESPTFDVGSLAGGLPGSTSAPKPIKFKVKGAGAPFDDVTVHLKARATSRAGIASDDWYGKVSGWTVTISGPVATQQTNCFLLSSSISAKVVVREQTVGGITGFHGTSPIGYGAASASPCGGISSQCSYDFHGVTGTADVVIAPSADGKTLAVKLNFHDLVDGSVSCQGTTLPVGGGLAGGYTEQYGSVATLTFPAESLPADQTLSWNVSGPIQASGSLRIHVEAG